MCTFAVGLLVQPCHPACRYVGVVRVIVASCVVPSLENEANLDAGQLSGCSKSVYRAARMLRPAPWIQQAAARFVQEKMAGEPYLAMHIRPYPDTCLQVTCLLLVTVWAWMHWHSGVLHCDRQRVPHILPLGAYWRPSGLLWARYARLLVFLVITCASAALVLNRAPVCHYKWSLVPKIERSHFFLCLTQTNMYLPCNIRRNLAGLERRPCDPWF
jgi:hypothetical protein